MDTFCGLGLPELVIIALVGFVLIGPERSRELALQAGRFMRQVVTSEWWGEFNQVSKAIRDLPNTLMRMSELEEAQAEIRQAMADIEAGAQIDVDFKEALSESKKATAGGKKKKAASGVEPSASDAGATDTLEAVTESSGANASMPEADTAGAKADASAAVEAEMGTSEEGGAAAAVDVRTEAADADASMSEVEIDAEEPIIDAVADDAALAAADAPPVSPDDPEGEAADV
ncbi:MAG: twin-arginine translocase TatA/TatE family subunit [Anaerolineae bacterium]|nr:twin-arginine translocase TatA/TatE family subunit [Anaerolineae bacterium]